jgi:hypothetical protein
MRAAAAPRNPKKGAVVSPLNSVVDIFCEGERDTEARRAGYFLVFPRETIEA